MNRRRRQLLLSLLCAIALTAPATAADDDFVIHKRDRFEMSAPDFFLVESNPPLGIALSIRQPPRTDHRDMAWTLGADVRAALGQNPKERPIDESVGRLPRELAALHRNNLLDGPTLENIAIPGSSGARLITYKLREGGMHVWHMDLYVNSGTDMFQISGFLSGRAGSEVLVRDFPPRLKLVRAMQTFRAKPATTSWPATRATTQPAAPAPASQPAR